MEHYYTQKPNTPHDLRQIEYKVKDISLRLTTDAGVFSKNRVDYGSHVLIQSLPPLSGDILDLGCGYGVIGLSLAKLNPDSYVTLVDINERAVALTQENIRLNNIPNARAFQSNGFENVEGKYRAIVSNPPIRAGKGVIYPLFEESIQYLLPGASLFLVIQKKQGAKSAVDKLISVFGNCDVINKEGGYWILRATNRPL